MLSVPKVEEQTIAWNSLDRSGMTSSDMDRSRDSYFNTP